MEEGRITLRDTPLLPAGKNFLYSRSVAQPVMAFRLSNYERMASPFAAVAISLRVRVQVLT